MAKLSNLKAGGVTALPGGSILSGTYDNNVTVEGNASIGAALIVNGNLTILGDLVNNGGYQVDINGNCTVDGGCNFNPDPATSLNTVTITGNFTINGEITTILPPTNATITFALDLGGSMIIDTTEDMSVLGLTPGVDSITMTSGFLTGQSFLILSVGFTDLTIDPNGEFESGFEFEDFTVGAGATVGYSFSMIPIIDSTTLTVGNDFKTGTVICGGIEISLINGNDIHIGGDFYGEDRSGDCEINMNGSWNPAATTIGGNGGNLVVCGTVYNSHIYSIGGNTSGASGNAGNGGNVTIGGFDSPQDIISTNTPTYGKEIKINGGNNSTSGTGGYTGGNGGNIDCAGGITTFGIATYGGTTSDSGNGGNGGNVLAGQSIISYTAINTYGSSCNQVNGEGSGGTGGRILAGGSIKSFSSGISTAGGGSRGNGDAGIGGNISCTEFNAASTINLRGGVATRNTTTVLCGRGGNGGTIIVRGDFVAGSNVLTDGGDTDASATNTELGGQGGNISVYGDFIAGSSILAEGGNSIRTTGNVGGQIFVQGFLLCKSTLNNSGGNANVSGTAGAPNQIIIYGGCSIFVLSSHDGTVGVATTQGSRVDLGGSCNIRTLSWPNRTGAFIRGYTTGTTLHIGAMTNSNSLVSHSSTNPTAAITASEGKIYTYSANFSRWSVNTGVLA